MMFNCGMDALIVMITKVVFSPLVGCSALQCLSIYEDDVVLFARPTTSDLTTVKGIFDAFG
jgi:hypothetical protein